MFKTSIEIYLFLLLYCLSKITIIIYYNNSLVYTNYIIYSESENGFEYEMYVFIITTIRHNHHRSNNVSQSPNIRIYFNQLKIFIVTVNV